MNVNKLIAPNEEDKIKEHWKYTDKIFTSIVCTTFNQDSYIKNAIDSFLAQKTEYRFEIIIHDDASTDKTREILKEYKRKYPDLIKLILQDENQYSKGNFRPFIFALTFAEGEYFALCEGDDYWIDSNKIQIEIQTLIRNESVSLVHTNAFEYIIKDSETKISNIPKEVNTTETLLMLNGIHTPTTMFRANDYTQYLEIFKNEINRWGFGDLPIWLYLSTVGEIKLIEENTTVYRVAEESASHSKNPLKNLNFYRSGLEIRMHMAEKYLKDDGESIYLKSLANRYGRMLINTDSKSNSWICKYADTKVRFALSLIKIPYFYLIIKFCYLCSSRLGRISRVLKRNMEKE